MALNLAGMLCTNRSTGSQARQGTVVAQALMGAEPKAFSIGGVEILQTV